MLGARVARSVVVSALVTGAVLGLQAGRPDPQARPPAASVGPAPPGAGLITMDALMDIKHPSGPVWSRDSKKVAFLWERTGVTDLYVVPVDGSAKPVAITSGGTGAAGAIWSTDNQWLYVSRGGQTVMIASDGSGQSRPSDLPGREAIFSKDGSQIAYVTGGAGGTAAAGGRGGRGARGSPAPPPTLDGGATAAAPGPTEIHIRQMTDGADVKVATFDGQVNGLAWTPDGQRLTFTSGGGGGGGGPIYHDETPAYSGAKIIYRTTENRGGTTPVDNYVVAASGGVPAKYHLGAGPVGGGGRGGTSRWIDATHVLQDRISPDFKHRSISVVDIATGDQRLVHDDVKTTFWSVVGEAQAGSQASPDGKWISFLSDRDGWDQLYLVPSAGAAGSEVQVTKGRFETWRPSWSPDGTRLVFDSNEGPNPGSRHIGLVTINGDPSKAVVTMVTSGRGVDVQAMWSPDGKTIVYQHSDPQNSADLYAVDVTRSVGTPVRLTNSMPASIDKALLTEPQLVHYSGPDGQPVPAYLFVPKNLNRAVKHPAIVWIHGDGVNQNYDGWHIQRNYAVYYSIHQYFLQHGYVVLAPDYRGSIGYGSAWREGVYMDVGGKDFRDAGLASTYLKTLPYVDADRLGVWGLSYGGFFTLLCVTEMPTAYRAAVDVAGVADYAMYYTDPYHGTWTTSRIGTPDEHPDVYAQASPVSHVDRLVRPLLILHGTADVNVPYLESVRLVDELLKHGKGSLVSFMTYPGEFHYFTREHVLRDAWTRVSTFWDEHLK